ncbi:MAG TPA: cupin domain-containing protein [Candidatus Eisenbacteria bacterium]|nr:cupin domain-containing protein [Candidatus Eisenbacteria bacterium]
MAFHVKSEAVPTRTRVHDGERGWGRMSVKKVYGRELSLMLAVRQPGYRSKPHFHESDQIVHVLKGEMWFFVEQQGFRCRKGDFVRIPANKIQWDWNRSDSEAVVIEAHAPALLGGGSGEGAVGLFDEAENPEARDPAKNTFVAYDSESVIKKLGLT